MKAFFRKKAKNKKKKKGNEMFQEGKRVKFGQKCTKFENIL